MKKYFLSPRLTPTYLFLMLSVSIFGQVDDVNQHFEQLVGKKDNIGLSAAYSVHGDMGWSKSGGFSCLENETPFDNQTLTRIASICKTFTAVAIMQLVEAQKMHLDDKIGVYLKYLSADKQRITVRQLLGHTAGIPGYRGTKEMENTIHYNSLDDAMQVFIDRPLLFDPGTSYSYTSYGYVILGRIIEEVTNQNYEDYMHENIFLPAEMQNTFVELNGKEYPNKSCLYQRNGKKVKSGKHNDLSNRVPGGGYISTLDDVMKFGNALLDEKLIRMESLDKLFEFQAVNYEGNKYGLGWYLYGPEGYESLVVGHSGGQTGCTSQLMIVPKTKTVVVVLSNTSGNYPSIVNFASALLSLSERTEK